MTFLIMCLAIVAMVAIVASATAGVLLFAIRDRLPLLAPAARARVYLALSALPLVASFVVLAAALAPSFGWIADHYGGEMHSHPHLCWAHPMAGWPSIPLTLVAVLVAARLLQIVWLNAYALALSWTTSRSMNQACTRNAQGVRIIPTDEAQAFVLGLFRPTIYATRGLISGPASQHLPAVLAHEYAHLQRLDPLRRFVANLGLGFHLPGIARWINSSHERALEMAADEQAAQEVGSRAAVASALVALAKARVPVPRAAFGALGSDSRSDVETRVLQLMAEGQHRDWPKRSTLFFAATAIVLAVAIGADTVHHKVEFLLGAFGS